jgi:hypothetical protein
MKKNDIYFIIFIILFFSPFVISEDVLNFYKQFNKTHEFIISFIKFGILATLGEIIGHRIKNGNYNLTNFGIMPRIVIWGFIGISIKIAFIVFSAGAPIILSKIGFFIPNDLMQGDFNLHKLLVAFTISFLLNIFYAPVMMTFHKITDMHIADNKGHIKALWTQIDMSKAFYNINWNVMWNFVFKKTIIFFWIPMQTITFLLPEEYQILYAAMLSIVLGVLLAIASLMGIGK